MPSSAGSLAGNTFHGTTIAEESKGVIVDDLETGLVERGSGVRLCDREPNSIGKTLAKRTGCDFNARGIVSFWMTRSFAIYRLHRKRNFSTAADDLLNAYEFLLTRKALISPILIS